MNMFFSLMSLVLLAQEAQGDVRSTITQLILVPLVILFIYLFVIRPQNKESESIKKMISELAKGDQVITSSGIHGKVVEFRDNDETIVLNIAKDTNVTFNTSAIVKKKP
jgi:preprotein translocase subunit YajC